jgi:hypothetical protein
MYVRRNSLPPVIEVCRWPEFALKVLRFWDRASESSNADYQIRAKLAEILLVGYEISIGF